MSLRVFLGDYSVPGVSRKFSASMSLIRFHRLRSIDSGLSHLTFLRVIEMKQMSHWFSKVSVLALSAMSASALAAPERWQLNMPKGVTSTSQTAWELHMIFFWICVVIGIMVFGAMIIAMFRFRKSKGAIPDTKFTHSTKLELIWTFVPVLILIYGGVIATKGLLAIVDSSNAEMTVKVTGYQWLWKYEIVDYKGKPTGVSFTSRLADSSNVARQLGSGIDVNTVENYLLDVDRPLVIPTKTKVRFVFTADDVIHAWWVPDLGWKQDAIPGIINDQWTRIEKPGVFRGVCAELCGKDHGFMPIVLNVVEADEFEQWLAKNGSGANAPAAVEGTTDSFEATPTSAATTPALESKDSPAVVAAG